MNIPSACLQTIKKLNPFFLHHNPVMFITEIGAIITTIEWIFFSSSHPAFYAQITIWLWLTVIFANFAESVAEARNQAQADSLRMGRIETMAFIKQNGTWISVNSKQLKKGDIVRVKAGEVIPGDGDVLEGLGSIDESSVTGESEPVIRSAGTDRSSVTAGTKLLSDEIIVKISSDAGSHFVDRMIDLIEKTKRKKSANEIGLLILLSGLTFIFLVVVAAMQIFGKYFKIDFSVTMLVALLVCLIPTTIGGLLSAIGIAGINRLMKKNVLAMSGQAIEAAGDVDLIFLDKTGTITMGARRATEITPANGVDLKELIQSCYYSSIQDWTDEGRSIIDFLKEHYAGDLPKEQANIQFTPFTAQSKMSSATVGNETYRKGAVDAMEKFTGKPLPYELAAKTKSYCEQGGTPLIVANNHSVLGVILLRDIIKQGLPDLFRRFRSMGIQTTMLTGDHPITAAFIAKEADVDNFVAQVTPEQKLKIVLESQKTGRMVAMTGDGVNDAPALASADVGVAMNSGTQAAKEAANMIDLDSNPTKLFEIIEIGKQMLMTRGALTTFSVSNDIAKYFAIVPAILLPFFPTIRSLNTMHLATPQSAVLSAVIFNALIILALIPFALKGVKMIPMPAAHILRRNLLIYGGGGVILPFIGIKLLDMLINSLGIV